MNPIIYSTCKTVIPGIPGVSLVEIPPQFIFEIVKGSNTLTRLSTMHFVKATLKKQVAEEDQRIIDQGYETEKSVRD
jgi:hypothetical protein